MRSLLLIIATLVLIVCGFVIYAQLQSPIAPRAEDAGLQRGPTSLPAGAIGSTTQPVVGGGSGAWVRKFDEKTAELESQFKADRYDPQPNGTWLVDRPVAEFMLGGGRLIRIEGTRGSVVIPDTNVVEGSEVRATPMSPPSRGQLHDVVISLFDDVPVEGQPPPAATMTVAMNNAAFDNETFLITTEPFTDAANNRVEADQVPVTVRGRDYDFDGRGLRIQWNDLNQRLQLLEIAHGESLTVKNRAKFDELQGGSTQEPAAAAPAETGAAPGKRSTPSAADAPTDPAATTAPATRPTVPYRASFEKDLRITEGEQDIATGSLMQVDFVLDKGSGDEAAPAAAAESSEGAANAGRKAAERPRAATTTPTTAEATTAPATQPAALLPIVVRWSGRLRVMPLEQSADDPVLDADEQVIRLAGTPLKLYRGGADIEAAGATFHTADGSASLRSSDEVPRVTLRDAGGAVVTTPTLIYSEGDGTATLTGPSSADIPLGTSGAPGERLLATWSEEAKLSLPPDERGEAVIRHANIKGLVAIAHPSMDLNSDALELSFAAPTTRPADAGSATQPSTQPSTESPELEKLIATGSVLAKLKEADAAASRSVHARRLELHTAPGADGKLLPRTIIADGDVRLTEPTQSLRADRLDATLAPRPTTAPASPPTPASPATLPAIAPTTMASTTATTQPATSPSTRPAGDMPEMIVESLVAQGAVRLDGENGAFATADQLIAVERPDESKVELIGNAIVSDGKNTITGGLLKLRPREQKAEVPGPGTLAFTPESTDGSKAQPVNVAWTGHASLDGKADLVELHDGVSFNTIDADGMTMTSRSNMLQIALVDKPTTRPTTEPTAKSTTQPSAGPTTAPAPAPATGPSGGGLGDLQNMDFLANKDPRSIKLGGDVTIDSTLLNAAGAVERRMYLRADEAHYDLETRRMVIPVNGRLLYEDHRPAQAQAGESDGPANRGTTAFEWKRQLTYDDAQQRAVMEGDVDIAHVSDAEGGESFRIATQRVTAELEPRPATRPATGPATAPTTAPATGEATTAPATQPAVAPTGMRLKRVVAEGGVNVRTDRFRFRAATLTYSPTTGILTARGAPDEPITLTDEHGQVDSAIESLTWNTKTDQVSIKGGRGRVRP